MSTSRGRLLLLDSASLYFRAFFGIPKTLRAPDGTAVNALRGILDFTSNLTTQYEPDAVVAAAVRRVEIGLVRGDPEVHVHGRAVSVDGRLTMKSAN